MSWSKKLIAENVRTSIALDNVSTGVMIADNERNIVYVNRSARTLLKEAEADIRKQLPNFNADKLVGVNNDSFHKNPAHQKGMLATFSNAHRTQIMVGGRTFALIANPVISDKGERLGAVVEWNDRTAEIAVEHEIANIVSAAGQGDFTKRISLNGKDGFFRNLGEGMKTLMETSDTGLNEVVRVLDAINTAAKEIASGNADLSHRTEQ